MYTFLVMKSSAILVFNCYFMVWEYSLQFLFLLAGQGVLL